MAGKPTPRKWVDIQLVIATISMTAVLAFWNMFAGPEKEKAAAKAATEEQAKPMPTATEIPIVVIPEATMPPPGYKILFGGEAPKPKVIIQTVKRGGGGGGGGGGDGGGGGGGNPTTSTGSS
jgi:hypothetical protein